MGDLIRRVVAASFSQIDRLVSDWLPNGHKSGNKWHVGNLHGDPGESLVINLDDGGFKDYSDGTVRGGDVVALYALMHGLSQLEAAKAIAPMVGVHDSTTTGRAKTARETAAAVPRKPTQPAAKKEWEPLNDPPADAPDWKWILTDRTRGDASRYWIFESASGRPSVIVVRWDFVKDGQRDKVVRPYCCKKHSVNGRMQWQQGWVNRPLPVLGLPNILANPSAPVIVAEGETSRDAAKKWARTYAPDAIVTTSLNGATNAKHSDWSWAKGRRILHWPDADETQQEYEAYLATNPPRPRDRDVSGTYYRDSVIKLCREAGAVHVDHIDRTKLAAALNLAELPRGFDAADVPADVDLDLRSLLADEDIFADDEEFVIVDDPEAPAGGKLVHVQSRRRGGRPSHEDLIQAISNYLTNKGIAPDALDGWRKIESWTLVNDDIAALANDFAFCYRHIDPDISQSRILETLEALTRRTRRECRAELLATITGKPATDEGREALRKWVLAVTGSTTDLDLAVMRHWIWNVKRMALALSTEHDLMPVVFGEQGSGKTTAVAMLVAPLRELSLDMDASYLTDDRKAPVLAAALIGRWEEMQGSQRADLEALKHTITSATIGFRPMRTNQTVVLPRTCSFIGTSNLPVDVMIQDTTGARRFVQLTTPKRCDWDLLHDLDPVKIWQSVSEKEPAPILDYLHLLREHQVELVHRDPVSLWLESERWDRLIWTRADIPEPYEIPKYDPKRGELFEEIAARLAMWCRTTGQASIGTKTLGIRLRQEGFTREQVRQADGRRPWIYQVPVRFLTEPPTTNPTTTPPNSEHPNATTPSTSPGW